MWSMPDLSPFWDLNDVRFGEDQILADGLHQDMTRTDVIWTIQHAAPKRYNSEPAVLLVDNGCCELLVRALLKR